VPQPDGRAVSRTGSALVDGLLPLASSCPLPGVPRCVFPAEVVGMARGAASHPPCGSARLTWDTCRRRMSTGSTGQAGLQRLGSSGGMRHQPLLRRSCGLRAEGMPTTGRNLPKLGVSPLSLPPPSVCPPLHTQLYTHITACIFLCCTSSHGCSVVFAVAHPPLPTREGATPRIHWAVSADKAHTPARAGENHERAPL